MVYPDFCFLLLIQGKGFVGAGIGAGVFFLGAFGFCRIFTVILVPSPIHQKGAFFSFFFTGFDSF